ncbi:MAG: T9SS type A sorting domain-containing protein [Ignavibacteriales bacterium]|nr:T9SS type A sorting domain-containing protein [Ignavibacteriales bacterium]
MRKLTTVGLLLLVFVGLAMGQVTLSLPTQTAANGTALALPVQVTGFNHVGSFSLTISFDKNVLTYTGTANQPTFGIFNGTPAATANTNGTVSISWFNVSPALNIGSGTLLNLLFTYKSGTSALTFTSTTPSSITDSLGTNLTATYTNGSVSGLPSTISLARVVGDPGDIFVPVTGANLKGLGSISLRIAYDTSKVTFVGLTNPALPFNAGTPSAGIVALSWFSTTPFSLNSGKLTDLKFTLKKDSTDLTIQGTSQVTDSVGNNVSITYVSGKIVKTPAPPVGLTLGSVRGVPGKDVSVPVSVVQMNNIGSISLKVTYDQTKLTFKQISNFAGSGFVTNASNGVLSFAWFGTSFLNIGTGKLMDVVFTYAGGSSVVGFNAAQSQVSDGVGSNLSVTFTNGSVDQDNVPKFTVIAAKSVAQVDTLSFSVLATDADAGDALTYTTGTLPARATFNATTKTFSWNPSLSTTPGVYNVMFYVADPVGGMDSLTVPITVTASNRKPSFVNKLADATATEGVALAFTYTATDPDANTTLTYTLVSAPAGATITSAGVFAFTPTAASPRLSAITAVVSDGSLTDTAKAVITVNHKPVFVAKTPATLTTASQNNIVAFTARGKDVDGGVLQYTWKVNNVVVKGPGTDSTYSTRFTDAHGAAKNVVAIYKTAAGLGDSTSATWSFTITDVATDPDGIPKEFALGQNYPNPFNPSTTIRYDLPKEAPVTLEVYNVLGVRVRTLLAGETVSAGRHTMMWDGRDDNGNVAPSGVYLYRVNANDFHASKKMTLVK